MEINAENSKKQGSCMLLRRGSQLGERTITGKFNRVFWELQWLGHHDVFETIEFSDWLTTGTKKINHYRNNILVESFKGRNILSKTFLHKWIQPSVYDPSMTTCYAIKCKHSFFSEFTAECFINNIPMSRGGFIIKDSDSSQKSLDSSNQFIDSNQAMTLDQISNCLDPLSDPDSTSTIDESKFSPSPGSVRKTPSPWLTSSPSTNSLTQIAATSQSQQIQQPLESTFGLRPTIQQSNNTMGSIRPNTNTTAFTQLPVVSQPSLLLGPQGGRNDHSSAPPPIPHPSLSGNTPRIINNNNNNAPEPSIFPANTLNGLEEAFAAIELAALSPPSIALSPPPPPPPLSAAGAPSNDGLLLAPPINQSSSCSYNNNINHIHNIDSNNMSHFNYIINNTNNNSSNTINASNGTSNGRFDWLLGYLPAGASEVDRASLESLLESLQVVSEAILLRCDAAVLLSHPAVTPGETDLRRLVLYVLQQVEVKLRNIQFQSRTESGYSTSSATSTSGSTPLTLVVTLPQKVPTGGSRPAMSQDVSVSDFGYYRLALWLRLPANRYIVEDLLRTCQIQYSTVAIFPVLLSPSPSPVPEGVQNSSLNLSIFVATQNASNPVRAMDNSGSSNKGGVEFFQLQSFSASDLRTCGWSVVANLSQILRRLQFATVPLSAGPAVVACVQQELAGTCLLCTLSASDSRVSNAVVTREGLCCCGCPISHPSIAAFAASSTAPRHGDITTNGYSSRYNSGYNSYNFTSVRSMSTSPAALPSLLSCVTIGAFNLSVCHAPWQSLKLLRTDGLVYPANPHLLYDSGDGSGSSYGLAGQLHAAAGPGWHVELQQQLSKFPSQCLLPGDVLTSYGGQLFQYGIESVIHLFIPPYDPSTFPPAMLSKAVRQVLQSANEHGVTTLGIPALGAGGMGWPASVVTSCICQSVVQWMTDMSTDSSHAAAPLTPSRSPSSPVFLKRVVMFDLSPVTARAFADSLIAHISHLSSVPVSVHVGGRDGGGFVGEEPSVVVTGEALLIFGDREVIARSTQALSTATTPRLLTTNTASLTTSFPAPTASRVDTLVGATPILPSLSLLGSPLLVEPPIGGWGAGTSNAAQDAVEPYYTVPHSLQAPPIAAISSSSSTTPTRQLHRFRTSLQPLSDVTDDIDEAISLVQEFLPKYVTEFQPQLELQLQRVSNDSYWKVEIEISLPDYAASSSTSTSTSRSEWKVLEAEINRHIALLSINIYASIKYPAFWINPLTYCQGPSCLAKLYEVNPNSKEFEMMTKKFLRNKFPVVITRVERVQNRRLWFHYMRVRGQIETECRSSNSSSSSDGGDDNSGSKEGAERYQLNEKLLFHGSSLNPPQAIYDQALGFDVTCADHGLFGKGVYFAEDSSYSHFFRYRIPSSSTSTTATRLASGSGGGDLGQQRRFLSGGSNSHHNGPSANTQNNNNNNNNNNQQQQHQQSQSQQRYHSGHYVGVVNPSYHPPPPPPSHPTQEPEQFQIIVGIVALGRVEDRGACQPADKGLERPTEGYHSVCGQVTDSQTSFIVYRNHQAYPAYVITYRMQDGHYSI